MTFSFMDLITIAALWVSALGLAFAIVKFFNTQVHSRITKVEERFDRELKEVKDEHTRTIDNVLDQIKSMIKDVKEEMHRATGRLDEFYKTMITLTRGTKIDE